MWAKSPIICSPATGQSGGRSPAIFEGVRGGELVRRIENEIPNWAISSRRGAPGPGVIVLPGGRQSSVRLLPPLTVSESEIREGVALMHAAAAALEPEKAVGKMNAPVRTAPKHFLDISDHDPATLRFTPLIEDAKGAQGGAARVGAARGAVTDNRPLDGKVAGDDFRSKQSTRTRISFDMAARRAERQRR